MHPRDVLGVPRLRVGQRPHVHLVEPERVRAVFVDDLVRVDHVLQRLAHLGDDALERLRKKKNLRILATGEWLPADYPALQYKRVGGGIVVQDRDATGPAEVRAGKVVTKRAPTEHEARDLLFAWRVGKFVKSNAIVYCLDAMTIGVGAGQMSRVYSARVAALKAADEGLEVKGSVMASDAFFPFRDGIDQAAEAGIVAVIQPGGSMRDEEVIAAADEHGMAMVFTGMRHFRH